jgi:hypothetical protein
VNIWSRYHPSMVLWSLSNESLWPHSVESSSYFRLIEQVSCGICYAAFIVDVLAMVCSGIFQCRDVKLKLISAHCWGQDYVELCLHYSACPHGMCLNNHIFAATLLALPIQVMLDRRGAMCWFELKYLTHAFNPYWISWFTNLLLRNRNHNLWVYGNTRTHLLLLVAKTASANLLLSVETSSMHEYLLLYMTADTMSYIYSYIYIYIYIYIRLVSQLSIYLLCTIVTIHIQTLSFWGLSSRF